MSELWEEWYRGMLELETKAGVIDEYVKVAFYNHLIFKKLRFEFIKEEGGFR